MKVRFDSFSSRHLRTTVQSLPRVRSAMAIRGDSKETALSCVVAFVLSAKTNRSLMNDAARALIRAAVSGCAMARRLAKLVSLRPLPEVAERSATQLERGFGRRSRVFANG